MILGMTVMEFIGQIFGLIAVVISFVAYQMPTQRKILFMNLLVTVAILKNKPKKPPTTPNKKNHHTQNTNHKKNQHKQTNKPQLSKTN